MAMAKSLVKFGWVNRIGVRRSHQKSLIPLPCASIECESFSLAFALQA